MAPPTTHAHGQLADPNRPDPAARWSEAGRTTFPLASDKLRPRSSSFLVRIPHTFNCFSFCFQCCSHSQIDCSYLGIFLDAERKQSRAAPSIKSCCLKQLAPATDNLFACWRNRKIQIRLRDMGLTKLRTSPRTPDDFPATQLFLLGGCSLSALGYLYTPLGQDNAR